jgi:hypothetical protein
MPLKQSYPALLIAFPFVEKITFAKITDLFHNIVT